MRFFINTKEAKHERPHVHVCPGKGPRTPDLKIWLDNMKTSLKGEMDAGDIAKAVKLVAAMKDEFIADYVAIHGEYKKRAKKK